MSLLQEVKVLKETANEEYSTVVKICYKNGDKVEAGSVIMELETSKAAFMIDAEKSGYIIYFCNEGDDVAVNAVIARIYDTQKEVEASPKSQLDGLGKKGVFSSAAIELIKKEKLNKNVFSGKDLVGFEDVQAYIKSLKTGKEQHSLTPDFIENELNQLIDSGTVRVEKITKSKQLEISNLMDVQSAGMNCVVAISVNIGGFLEFAQSHLDLFKDSILSVVIFEVSRLLKKYPELNAFFTENNIAYYQKAEIGLAVDMGSGLKVVKMTNACQKSINEIEAEILQSANKYIDKKLTLDDVSGITFTITDLSREGVIFFTPLINKQQSAILGISAVDERINCCILTLAFDHRVTDGKRASEFLNELKTKLENYGSLQKGTVGMLINNATRGLKCHNCLITLEEIKKLDGLGLLRVVDCDGKERLLCQTCLLGF